MGRLPVSPRLAQPPQDGHAALPAPAPVTAAQYGLQTPHMLAAGSLMITPSGAQPIGEPALGGGSGRNLAERKEWTAAEDAQIIASVKKHGQRWRLIAAELPGRSDDAVRNRWNRVKDAGNETPGREELSVTAGPPAAAPHVSARSTVAMAADSWSPRVALNESRPERVSWSRKEDETIVRLVSEIGNKWHAIAECLPGRTEHAIRNRFARLQSLVSRGKPLILSSGTGMPIGIQLVPQSAYSS